MGGSDSSKTSQRSEDLVAKYGKQLEVKKRRLERQLATAKKRQDKQLQAATRKGQIRLGERNQIICEHTLAKQELLERFEQDRLSIALEFVKLTTPLAWWRADWLRDAFADWWSKGKPGSQRNKNLQKVTHAMGQSPYYRKRPTEKLVTPQNLEVAVAFCENLHPSTCRLKKLVKHFAAKDQMGYLATWIITGEKPEELARETCLLPDGLAEQERTLIRDFQTMRAIFGAKMQMLDQQLVFQFRDDQEDGAVDLRNFLPRFTRDVPKRITISLAAKRYSDVSVRKLETLFFPRRS